MENELEVGLLKVERTSEISSDETFVGSEFGDTESVDLRMVSVYLE